MFPHAAAALSYGLPRSAYQSDRLLNGLRGGLRAAELDQGAPRGERLPGAMDGGQRLVLPLRYAGHHRHAQPALPPGRLVVFR